MPGSGDPRMPTKEVQERGPKRDAKEEMDYRPTRPKQNTTRPGQARRSSNEASKEGPSRKPNKKTAKARP